MHFSHWTAVAPLSKISWAHVCVPISGFSVMLHQSMCLFLYQDHSVLMNVLILGRVISLKHFKLFKDCVNYSRACGFSSNFLRNFSQYIIHPAGILIVISLNLLISLRRIDIFLCRVFQSMSIFPCSFPIHEHGVPFPLFSFSLITFIKIL